MTHTCAHAIQTKQQFPGHVIETLINGTFVKSIRCIVEDADPGVGYLLS